MLNPACKLDINNQKDKNVRTLSQKKLITSAD